MRQTLKTFKWWWSWTPEVIEDYLEAMAMQGWQLAQVGFGMFVFHFEKSQPEKIRYCVEYNPNVKGDYITLLGDDGWQLMGQTTGWLLWQKPYEDKRPELFTEPEALIERNYKLLKVLYLLFGLQIANIIIQSTNHTYNSSVTYLGGFSLILLIFLAITLFFFVWVFFKIKDHNRRLRNHDL